MTVIERQTYSLLELLGDVGGLFDAFRLLGGLLVQPLANFSMKVYLMTLAYSQISENSADRA